MMASTPCWSMTERISSPLPVSPCTSGTSRGMAQEKPVRLSTTTVRFAAIDELVDHVAADIAAPPVTRTVMGLRSIAMPFYPTERKSLREI